MSAETRQEAKAITYGIIYGMGVTALSHQMGVNEMTAEKFMKDFMRSYPKIQSFLDETVKFCRKEEYIETISGRKRFLPSINSRNMDLQGERIME